MHMSGPARVGKRREFEENECCPHTSPEDPQVMNIRRRPKAQEDSELHDFSRFPERLLLLLIYYIV